MAYIKSAGGTLVVLQNAVYILFALCSAFLNRAMRCGESVSTHIKFIPRRSL